MRSLKTLRVLPDAGKRFDDLDPSEQDRVEAALEVLVDAQVVSADHRSGTGGTPDLFGDQPELELAQRSSDMHAWNGA